MAEVVSAVEEDEGEEVARGDADGGVVVVVLVAADGLLGLCRREATRLRNMVKMARRAL